MFAIKKTFKTLTTSAITLASIAGSKPSMAAWQQQPREVPPQQVVEQVYTGIRYIYGDTAVCI